MTPRSLLAPGASVGTVHSLVALVLLGSFAYVGTMIDNFFAFAAQLTLTAREQFRTITSAQTLGVVVLVGLAVAVGSSLDVVPIRVVGVLAIAPWALAWRHWHHRRDAVTQAPRRGVTTTFVVTLGLGGDNLAVWIPLLRANGVVHAIALCVIFACCQVLFIALSWVLATHPRVVSWGRRSGPYFVPWLYVILGFVILAECHVFAFS